MSENCAIRVALGLHLIAVCASGAYAREVDTQFWAGVGGSTRAADDLAITANVERRFRAAGDQNRFSVKADWTVVDGLVLGSGALFSDSNGKIEFRPHQHATFALGQFQLRSQIEQRFFENAPRPQLRVRQRLQWRQGLTKKDSLTLSGEFYYNARPELRTQRARVDQWRLMAMYQKRLSSTLDVSASYLFIHAPRDGKEDRISHVPQIALSFRF